MPIRLVIPATGAMIAASLSHASPIESELARCAVVPADAARLICFDALASDKLEHVFTGKGAGVTALFNVAEPRLLHFASADVIMVAYLLREDGAVAKNLHLGGQGVGEHLIVEPGEYRVQVNASGEWRIWLTTAEAR